MDRRDKIVGPLLQTISSFPLAFGGGAISGQGGGYGFGKISEEESISLLHEAYDLSFRIFDTAPIYGFGLSEERIGKAFCGQRRQNAFIVSKAGIDWDQNQRVNRTNKPSVVQKMLEESLKRLQTDCIDLYMIHWPDESCDIRKPIEVLEKARKAGKVKYIGLCNTTIEDLEKAREVTEVSVVQSEFNLINRKSGELFSYLKKKNISFMAWGALDKGILSQRVSIKREQSKDYDTYDARKNAIWWNSHTICKKITRLDRYFDKLKEYYLSPLNAALGFILQQPVSIHALVGVRNSDQLHSAVEAIKQLPLLKDIEFCYNVTESDPS